MAGKARVYELDRGRVSMRVVMPDVVAKFAQVVGEEMDQKGTQATLFGMRFILDELGALIERGDIGFLSSAVFDRALQILRNKGPVARGVPQEIDINLLHRSPKLKSGFVGVYAGGNGFRAQGRSVGGTAITIGTYKTAEEAAWRRRQYYVKHGLAYGELEAQMDLWRAEAHKWGVIGYSDEQLIAAIEDHHRTVGLMHELYGPGTCSIRPATIKQDAPMPAPSQIKMVGFEDGDLPPEVAEMLEG